MVFVLFSISCCMVTDTTCWGQKLKTYLNIDTWNCFPSLNASITSLYSSGTSPPLLHWVPFVLALPDRSFNQDLYLRGPQDTWHWEGRWHSFDLCVLISVQSLPLMVSWMVISLEIRRKNDEISDSGLIMSLKSHGLSLLLAFRKASYLICGGFCLSFFLHEPAIAVRLTTRESSRPHRLAVCCMKSKHCSGRSRG